MSGDLTTEPPWEYRIARNSYKAMTSPALARQVNLLKTEPRGWRTTDKHALLDEVVARLEAE